MATPTETAETNQPDKNTRRQDETPTWRPPRPHTPPVTQQSFSVGILVFYALLTMIIFFAYPLAVDNTHNAAIMPLDDSYIHFQYARQLAEGQPYVYNPGDPPTSGATSFIYPYLLATGYLLGFTGFDLGLWAAGIGALALIAAGWLVYRIAGFFATPSFALLTGAAFIISGAMSWHAMSGMETMLVCGLVLLVFHTVLYADNIRSAALAAAILALARPEGGIMAIVLVAWALLRCWRRKDWRGSGWLILPIAAFALQPSLNFALTGSFSASGSSAKSILGTIPFYIDDIAARILNNFTRMWLEFLTGGDPARGPLLIGPLAIIGFVWLVRDAARRPVGVLLILWLLAVTAALSTLDTAFWHFKRYQMPLIALLFPLAAWGITWILNALDTRFSFSGWLSKTAPVITGICLMLAMMPSALEFHRLYHINAENVVVQPLAMADFLADQTPLDTVVAVHDVGMMRYRGDRHTVDMVGLTTPGAADYWRAGPGSVAAFLLKHEPRPDYIAAYTTARGLNFLADTSIYGPPIAEFPAPPDYDPSANVALAADFQGIYRADWSAAERANTPATMGILHFTDGLTLVDQVNLADLESEAAANYGWRDERREPGFVTEVYEFTSAGDTAPILDTGRRINGEELFTLTVRPDEDALLISRVLPQQAGTLDIYINGDLLAQRWIPEMPGRWLEIPIVIPAAYLNDDSVHVRIIPDVPGGHYRPYRHWLYQGDYTIAELVSPAISFQADALRLSAEIEHSENQLIAALGWESDGATTGDYKVFIHIYADIDAPPILQRDTYLGGDTLPVGNLPPGVIFDSLVVDLTQLPPGSYRVAVGLYDPMTFERLLPETIPSSEIETDEAGRRVFISEFEITDDE